MKLMYFDPNNPSFQIKIDSNNFFKGCLIQETLDYIFKQNKVEKELFEDESGSILISQELTNTHLFFETKDDFISYMEILKIEEFALYSWKKHEDFWNIRNSYIDDFLKAFIFFRDCLLNKGEYSAIYLLDFETSKAQSYSCDPLSNCFYFEDLIIKESLEEIKQTIPINIENSLGFKADSSKNICFSFQKEMFRRVMDNEAVLIKEKNLSKAALEQKKPTLMVLTEEEFPTLIELSKEKPGAIKDLETDEPDFIIDHLLYLRGYLKERVNFRNKASVLAKERGGAYVEHLAKEIQKEVLALENILFQANEQHCVLEYNQAIFDSKFILVKPNVLLEHKKVKKPYSEFKTAGVSVSSLLFFVLEHSALSHTRIKVRKVDEQLFLYISKVLKGGFIHLYEILFSHLMEHLKYKKRGEILIEKEREIEEKAKKEILNFIHSLRTAYKDGVVLMVISCEKHNKSDFDIWMDATLLEESSL